MERCDKIRSDCKEIVVILKHQNSKAAYYRNKFTIIPHWGGGLQETLTSTHIHD
uniref:Uncharacterized protein n=1 Tax=Lepeophtheirus salmonis TaxID=72036 RepID=A0A0K2UAN5_LEPSM